MADKARGRVATLSPQVESLAREIELEADAVVQGVSSERSTESEVLARLRAAQADVSAAENDLAREIKAVEQGVSPAMLREKAETTLQLKRAALDGMQHSSEALVATHHEAGDSRRRLKEQLERQHAELASDLAAANSELAQHELAIENLAIRAPIAGTLGDVQSALRPGSVVHEGDVIATIVPTDKKLHVIAEYGPEAIGRVKPGQRAHMRLDGFPWTHYGTIDAQVTSVGSELRDNAIRVELAVDSSRLVTTNGMTGVVDIEIDRVSPLRMFLQMVGQGAR